MKEARKILVDIDVYKRHVADAWKLEYILFSGKLDKEDIEKIYNPYREESCQSHIDNEYRQIESEYWEQQREKEKGEKI